MPAAPSSERLKKVQTVLYLEPEQFQALKALSERVPAQIYLQEGVDLVLARYAERKAAKR